MRSLGLIIAPILTLSFGGSAIAADFADPTWPCVQRKVETLSPGLMWPVPIDPDFSPSDAAEREEISDMAKTLALRRVDLESISDDVDSFGKRHEGDPGVLGQVFLKAFETLNKRRSRIIDGIADFSLGQIALADDIDQMRVDMDEEMAGDTPNFDRVDALEERLDWSQVIYSDRQRSITYLCETPVILERRLFEIAQMLQGVMRDDA